MKTKLAVLTVVLLSVCVLMGPSAKAIGISIDLNPNDRVYYTDGPSYWDDGYEWVFVGGHWGDHHRWISGHYERHGEFHRERAGEHHHHHHDHDGDHDHDHH
jgi:hypothetical protein